LWPARDRSVGDVPPAARQFGQRAEPGLAEDVTPALVVLLDDQGDALPMARPRGGEQEEDAPPVQGSPGGGRFAATSRSSTLVSLGAGTSASLPISRIVSCEL
jgi:hypothetical protein